ncbi:hypothetical protein OJF2_14190 [Aquisphaera giovannonii]|uniref:Uncharacterized protein n=2 Tax=Aquisphaera giovannonii TaxID=406548 RepID=A0A5B9VYD2_9BACT|nr:hypothetical protein OJF2_14190 [Aquisphaera giovannonii]
MLRFLFNLPSGETVLEGPVAGSIARLRLDDDVAFLGVNFDCTLKRSTTPNLMDVIARLLTQG